MFSQEDAVITGKSIVEIKIHIWELVEMQLNSVQSVAYYGLADVKLYIGLFVETSLDDV